MNLIIPRLLALSVLATLSIYSCKRSDEGEVYLPYSGFKVDGVVYAVDSLVKDTSGPGSRARLYSSTGAGGMVLIETSQEAWPTADSSYSYMLACDLGHSGGVLSVSFFPDSQQVPSFCMHSTAFFTGGVSYTSRNGKWSPLTIGYRSNEEDDSHEHYLGVNYTEP